MPRPGLLIARAPLYLLALAGCGSRAQPAGGSDDPGGLFGNGMLSSSCVSATFAAERYPLALLLLVDQSLSMSDPVPGGTKWSVAASAIERFVDLPGLDGIALGVQYFGLPSAQTNGQAFLDSCDPGDYARPDVEIAPLGANAARVVASLEAHGPASGTPTEPALVGAARYATAWALARTGVVPIIALVTDGEPYGCRSTVSGTAAVAAAAASQTPPIRTFVIGLGSDLESLAAIAKAGGTEQPYLVDTTGNVGDRFAAALDDVRRRMPCSYAIPQPDSGTLDFRLVNVTVGPGEGTSRALAGQVSGIDACPGSAAPAWYYAPPDAPQSIQLCPNTCEAVSGGAHPVEIALGCQTQAAVLR